jgi:hypothetical protein
MNSTVRPSFPARCWRAVRRFVFILGTIVGLVTLFYLIENLRGHFAWTNYRAELMARGERLGVSDYAAKPVPAEQNFAETPALRSVIYRKDQDAKMWAKWNSVQGVQNFFPMGEAEVRKEDAAGILEAFKELEPELEELRVAAALRPYAQFTNSHTNVFLADVPNFVALRQISQLMSLHAMAELQSGHAERAFADMRAVQRVADSLAGQGTLVTAMIRTAILGLSVRPFAAGLTNGMWSDEQLLAWQKYFDSVDLLAGFDAALRGGERNGVIQMMETLPREELTDLTKGFTSMSLKDYFIRQTVNWCPRGWFLQNNINYCRAMEKSYEAYDARAQRVFPEKSSAAITFINEQLESVSPYEYLMALGVPNVEKATQVTAHIQTSLRQAALACALERYRRARGEYPETLATLVPQFTTKLPNDLMTGEGLKYQRPQKDQFALYAVGWNVKDDHGTSSTNHTDGDWVWPPAAR